MSSFGAAARTPMSCSRRPRPAAPAAEARAEQLLLLSARSSDALDRAAEMLRAHLAAEPDISLADAAYTLQVGRRRFDHRHAIVATSPQDAIALLESSEPARVASATDDTQRSPVAFLFPGQGAQRVNMGRGLYETEPVFRSQIDECSELLRAHLDKDLRSILYPRDEDAATAQAELTQTGGHAAGAVRDQLRARQALGALGHRARRHDRPQPRRVRGRKPRGRLQPRRCADLGRATRAPDAGGALGGHARRPRDRWRDQLIPRAKRIDRRIQRAEAHRDLRRSPRSLSSVEALESRGIAAKRLATSHAFHSSMMDPIVERFAEMVRQSR